MNDLYENGFLILPNKNKKETFEKHANDFYKDNNVDYPLLKQFIDREYFTELGKLTNIIENINYGKFRFSNNNNSSDAATFHGDIYNHTNDNIMKVYTCLYYFDDAQFEVVPKSHRKDNQKLINSHDSFNNRKRFDIKAGTFIIIHANVHHRGVNFKQCNNRRLLQIFEVTMNNKDYEKYVPNIIVVETWQSYLMKCVSYVNKNLFKTSNNDSLTYFHYRLMYNDLQYKLFALMDLSPSEKHNKLVSYESGPQVEVLNCKNSKETNMNIICDPHIKHVGPGYFYFYCYILYWIVSIIVIYIFYKYIYKSISKVKQFTKKGSKLRKNIRIF